MHWSKKNKGIVIFLIVIVAVVLLCLGDYGLRYYDTPKEETYDYVGSGMLVGLVNPAILSTGSGRDSCRKGTFYLEKSGGLYSGKCMAGWRKDFW